jgi:hypothetical protein
MNKMETRRYEEVKEYSDAYTQHDLAEFTSSTKTQTDPEPKVRTRSMSTQTTDPRTYVDAEVQMDEIPSRSRSASPDNVETMASSSSTIVPPTPKPALEQIHSDLPPAYNQVAEQNRRAIEDWHKGATGALDALPVGLSNDALREWASLKKEMGVECAVIETIISKSTKTGQPRQGKAGLLNNIYSTYIYNKDGVPSFTPVAQVVMCLCASATMIVCLTPFMMPYMMPHYSIPGGPSYYDRSAWAGFNTIHGSGEGFSPGGASALWSFVGSVGDGAARIVRGWPT